MSPIYHPKQRIKSRTGKLSEFEQLLREALRIYKTKIPLFLFLAVILLINSFVLAGTNYFVFRVIGISLSVKSFLAVLFWLVILAGTIYAFSACQVMMLLALKEKKRGQVAQLYAEAKETILNFAKLYVYVRFLIFIWLLPFIAAMIALLVKHGQPFGSDAEIIAAVLPALPLVIPGLVFILFYVFAPYIFVYEGKGIREAVKKSRLLVSGSFWPLLGKYTLLLLLNLAVYSFAAWLTSYLPQSIGQFVLRLLDGLISPLYTVFGFLLYKEVMELRADNN